MAQFTVEGVRVAGVASAVPESVQTVADVAARYGADEAAKISQSIGVEQRHVAAPETCASDLCHAAAERLLADLGWERDTIEGLVFVSQSPDYFAPATSCLLHQRLGLSPGCAAFDINLGCSGYVYGLAAAAPLCRGFGAGEQSGRVLLLVGDTITKMLAADDRSTTPLFGDAGSATALEASADAAPMSFCLGTDGSGAESLIVREGGFRQPIAPGATPGPDGRLFMDGAEVFRFALSSVPKLYRRTIAAAGWEADDVQGVVMHQSNRFMLEHFRKRLKLDAERFVVGLKDYGNASCTSIPLAMSDAWGGPGTRVDKRAVLVGFGVGWSWGGVALTLADTAAPPVVVMPEPSARQRDAA